MWSAVLKKVCIYREKEELEIRRVVAAQVGSCCDKINLMYDDVVVEGR
jgi:hypothetical protein